MGITKELIEGWSFTEIGGGQGTKDGEWLDVERVPTTVHVELLKADRIPDPVSREKVLEIVLIDIPTYPSSSAYTSGMYSVCPGSSERQLFAELDR